MEEWCKIQIDIYSQLIHYQYPVIFTYQQQSSADPILTKFILELKTFSSMPKQFSFFLILTRNIFFGVFKVVIQICALLKVAIKRIKTLNGFYRFLDAFISEFAVIPPS